MLPSWSSLQRVENRELFMEMSTRLEDTVRDIFSNMGGSVIFAWIHLASFFIENFGFLSSDCFGVL
jgi:hypothetical protein